MLPNLGIGHAAPSFSRHHSPKGALDDAGSPMMPNAVMSPTNTTDRRAGEALTCFLILTKFVPSMTCRDDQALKVTRAIALGVYG